jgi:hypothetical protein
MHQPHSALHLPGALHLIRLLTIGDRMKAFSSHAKLRVSNKLSNIKGETLCTHFISESTYTSSEPIWF